MSQDTLTEIRQAPADEPEQTDEAEDWWPSYRRRALSGLSDNATEVVAWDSDLIAQAAFPTANAWEQSRVRTGIVVGAVQSGKTASMLAVAARALDADVDLVLILGGTRLALLQQTYIRTLRDLDGSEPTRRSMRMRRHNRLFLPAASVIMTRGQVSPRQAFQAEASKIEDAIVNSKPIIIVMLKQQDHLREISKTLKAAITSGMDGRDDYFNMMVLDDEADDGSIMDTESDKVIPTFIEMLWKGKGEDSTFHPKLRTTYIAYTATPQANFLQATANPLAPRDFCIALRTPYKGGSISDPPLSPTFIEPAGLPRYYCGGEMFYHDASPQTCHTTPFPNQDASPNDAAHRQDVQDSCVSMLDNALKAFFMATAIKFFQHEQAGGLLPSGVISGVGAKEALPPTSTMLVHPSALTQEHFRTAAQIAGWSKGKSLEEIGRLSDEEAQDLTQFSIDLEGLKEKLNSEENDWKHWLVKYRESLSAIEMLPGAPPTSAVPEESMWGEIHRILEQEVFPYVSLKIINSHELADNQPNFNPRSDAAQQRFFPAEDSLTIFVSGNIVARGVTIEGLTTSVFTRTASENLTDTQMQMQRWFGYRGSSIHLCRLFCFKDQLELFKSYHTNDQALRREILSTNSSADSPLVLHGPNAVATAKVRASRLPLRPGSTPSVRLLEIGDYRESNIELLGNLLNEGRWNEIKTGETVRGLIRENPSEINDIANILEEMRFTDHCPNNTDLPVFTRWESLSQSLGLVSSETPLFRPPSGDSKVAVRFQECPYSLAAYLRLWAAASRRRRCDGLYPSDRPGMPWTMGRSIAPKFYIGVRFGTAGLSTENTLSDHNVQAAVRGKKLDGISQINTLWGTRGRVDDEYHGDQLFDYHFHDFQPPSLLGGPVKRPREHPGLLLFYVIRVEDQTKTFDTVTFGLCLPEGGPEHIAATRLS